MPVSAHFTAAAGWQCQASSGFGSPLSDSPGSSRGGRQVCDDVTRHRALVHCKIRGADRCSTISRACCPSRTAPLTPNQGVPRARRPPLSAPAHEPLEAKQEIAPRTKRTVAVGLYRTSSSPLGCEAVGRSVPRRVIEVVMDRQEPAVLSAEYRVLIDESFTSRRTAEAFPARSIRAASRAASTAPLLASLTSRRHRLGLGSDVSNR